MRWNAILLVLAICGCGAARAQDFQIGGDQDRQTEILLEVRPSLGLFVLGYINGHGPYRFTIGAGAAHTMLMQRVVKEAGLPTRVGGRTYYGDVARAVQKVQVVGTTLRVGDRDLSLDGAEVFPEDDLAAYVPVADFGGVLGVELFRQGVVDFDISHKRLVLAASNDMPKSDDTIEVPLEQSATGVEMDRLPAVTMTLNGKPGKFRLVFTNVSVSFSDDSALGSDLLGDAHDVQAATAWTPGGSIRLQTATDIVQVELAGHVLGKVNIARRADPPPMPVRASSRTLVLMRAPAVDGVVGLGVFGRYDIAIDNLAGKAWFVPRGKHSFQCYGSPKPHAQKGVGFHPWLYKEQGVIAAIIEGSVADRAGLHAGDRIVSIDDGTVPQYYERLDATPCGGIGPTKVVYRNASGEHTAMLTPEASQDTPKPGASPAVPASTPLGGAGF